MTRTYWDHWLSTLKKEEPGVDMRFLRRLLENSISTILDIGSGYGSSSRSLAQLGFRVTCADYSSEAVQYLKEASRILIRGHMDVVCADALFLPFRDESFGAATSLMMMNFFIDEPERKHAFSEIFRVVEKDGIMLFMVLSDDDEGMTGGTPMGNHNVRHPDGLCLHYYTMNELEDLLAPMYLEEIERFRQEDVTHGDPHAHDLIRVLASRRK
ncbi:MAG: class I SAM-dependent methyltransferase [Theionarchaea archaeon]|nr:class I SAM-dependent methyltransferase [Theionarchaea archaeon]MBU6999495.1 class I SAM-dependent methyltransferase [Theionarchaea archaeon]MBU7041011.1 class I SAM-dependent methyltransferase [Theionarchaea archaeon]